MELQQLELDLWQSLATATQFPDTADLRSLYQALEQTIEPQPLATQLQVAATVLLQLSEVHAARVHSMLDTWERRFDPQEPIVDLEGCVELFVQSSQLDVEDLMAAPEAVQYPEQRRLGSQAPAEESVVAELDKAQLLAALDQQMEQHPGMTEAAAFNQAIAVAHAEDISTWVAAIAAYLQQCREPAVSFLELVEAVQYPDSSDQAKQTSLVRTWLTLLLGGFSLEQRGEFYSSDIWVETAWQAE